MDSVNASMSCLYLASMVVQSSGGPVDMAVGTCTGAFSTDKSGFRVDDLGWLVVADRAMVEVGPLGIPVRGIPLFGGIFEDILSELEK